jgi:hypothetical protein
MVIGRALLLAAPAVLIAAGAAVKPERAVRPWSLEDAPVADRETLEAARFNFGRLHPTTRWAVLSWSAEGGVPWPEPSAVECGPSRRVTARSLYGVPMARGLVHCTGKQVIWE